MSDNLYNVVVIYEHRDKFIAKWNEEFCHIKKNEFTKDLELKRNYKISAKKYNEVIKDKPTNIFILTGTPELMVEQKKEVTSQQVAKPEIDFEDSKKDFLENPYNETKFNVLKTHSKLKVEWEKEFELLLQSRPELKIRFPNRDEETNDDKFLIHDSQRKDFKPDTFIQRFNMSIKVKVVGKTFNFRNRSKKNKSNFKDGEPVCYVYYTKDAPNWTADEFMLAMKAYSEVLDLLKSNGVKPRHKPELVARLKELPVICDSRNRLMGHSWIAIGDEDIWYCTYLLSSVAIENNIKINGRFAQCWRVSKRHIREYIDTLYGVDTILFKSNAFPMISTNETSILEN